MSMWNQYKNLSRLSSTAADAAKRGYVATKHLAKQSYQKRLFQHPKNSLVPVTLLTEDDIRLFAHHEAAGRNLEKTTVLLIKGRQKGGSCRLV
jgi:hypothetical protein